MNAAQKVAQLPNKYRLERPLWAKPPSRSIRIIDLGDFSCQNLQPKGLIVKIFINNDLARQRALKIVLGQLRGASRWTDTSRNCPNQISIVGLAGL